MPPRLERIDYEILEQMVDACRYAGRAPAMTRDLLDAACKSDFLEEQAG